MKKKYLFILLFPLITACSDDNEHDLGMKYHQFLDKLNVAVPSNGGSFEIRAENNTIFISHISAIRGKDTINTNFGVEENQLISSDWYTLEVNSYKREEGKDGGGIIKVSLAPLESDIPRELIILVGNGFIANKLIVSQ